MLRSTLSIIARRCLKSLEVKSEAYILFKLPRFRKRNTHTVQKTLEITKKNKKIGLFYKICTRLFYVDVPKWSSVKLDLFSCLARDQKSLPQRRLVADIFGKEVDLHRREVCSTNSALQLHANLSVYFRNGHNRWILYPEGSFYSSGLSLRECSFWLGSKKVRFYGGRLRSEFKGIEQWLN